MNADDFVKFVAEKIFEEVKRDAENRDGQWCDKWGACKICGGEIPHGHTDNCDVYKLEMEVRMLRTELAQYKGKTTVAASPPSD